MPETIYEPDINPDGQIKEIEEKIKKLQAEIDEYSLQIGVRKTQIFFLRKGIDQLRGIGPIRMVIRDILGR